MRRMRAMVPKIVYENTVPAIFLKRNNRFTAEVLIDGKQEKVHVKNTGRLSNLLLPDVPVTLQKSDNENRSTLYDLISVYSKDLGWVNVDSLVTNQLMKLYLNEGYDYVKPEYKYGDSRVDFYAEKNGEKYLIEVKGCTLTYDVCSKAGYFPDAPTERGIKHLKELAGAVKEGYHCSIDFVIQMNGIDTVLPNDKISPEFGIALAAAKKAGVEVNYHRCRVHADRIELL